jgi:hypothetical protein
MYTLLRVCLVALMVAIVGPVSAQYVAADSATNAYKPLTKKESNDDGDNGDSFMDRVRLGGNFGLSFGEVTYVEASPLAIYSVTDKLQVGPGITYIYYNYSKSGYSFTSNQYGARFFSRYFVLENIFAHAEVEALSVGVANDGKSGRYTIVNPLLGGGYRQEIGDRSYITVTALYNTNYIASRSTYNSPLIFRFGFAF